MNAVTYERLWGFMTAFDHAATIWLVVFVLGVFALATGLIALVSITGRVNPAMRKELWLRLVSWGALVVVLGAAVLAGAFWTISVLLLVSLWCYREFARATGLFRERVVSATVILGILFVYAAVFDHWYGFFVALIPLGVVVIAAISIPLDRPDGYIQRTGLAVFGFLLFGGALGHLAYVANDTDYRPILLMVLIAVSLSDVSAFTVGKLVGGPKLAPQTSPNKSVSGALGALLVTTVLVVVLSGPVFTGTTMEGIWHRVGLGLLIGGFAQLGDLMLSSIKRDIGIKDMGAVIPGHGGILDRFNSLLLVSPAVFHYVGVFNGFGLAQPVRILF